ncbi:MULTISPECIES: glycosyltransferase family 2 protein [Aerosakkonema]|uniref:glycosyltransferase family 2 protein n=1 Tax=Aerosakkonema TaxID=1246629 RepID=UPI0035BAEB20
MPPIAKVLTLKDLPAPPPDRTGWPWTEESQPLPQQMPDGSEWPRISIVTPSYNYGHFIEETIRSVLLQGYPNLEYIIIDGGSTDHTVEIIKKYEKYVTYWVSEPDEGQTDAINKGFQLCTGQIFAWLNADCSYTISALQKVANYYLNGYKLIAGGCVVVYNDGREEAVYSVPTDFERYLKFWIAGCGFTQADVFLDKELANDCFPLDKKLYMVMDYQYFLRALSKNPKQIYVQQTWSKDKLHGNNKTLIPYEGGMAEFSRVALAESTQLPLIQHMIYTMDVKDYLVIHSLTDGKHPDGKAGLLTALFARPTLLRWPVFWKMVIKAIWGEKIYSWLMKSIGR